MSKRKKEVRKIAKDKEGNIYLLYDNVIQRVDKGTNTGKFYCYAGYWILKRRKLDFEYDYTIAYF